jgi:uncharacterized protein YceK
MKVRLRTPLVAMMLASAALVLSGCNSDGSTTAASAGTSVPRTGAATSDPNTAAGASQKPAASITGTPSNSATVGQTYSFSAQLQTTGTGFAYSIQNSPTWATFDTTTGTLSGTPAAADVGSYASITIAATNGTVSATLAPFAIVVVQPRTDIKSVTLSWLPPTQNADGSSLTDLAGYYVYYGAAPDSMERSTQITNPGLTAYTVGDLGPGTHYFSISAYTFAGVEGTMSGIASKTIM